MRLAFIVIMGLATGVLAEDWCQWRGPALNGTSPETGLPDSLGEDQETWVIDLPGPGECTPVICDSRIYLSGYDEAKKQVFAMQVEAESGKVLWSKTVSTFDALPKRNLIASPSPVADSKGVVFTFSTGEIVRFSKEGKELWRRNLTEDYGPLTVDWSYSSSPLLYNGTLYVEVLRKPNPPKGSTYSGEMPSFLLGLELNSGEVVFKVDRPTDAKKDFTDAYSTPTLAKVRGKMLVLVYGGNYITAHDPKTGKERWRCNYMDEKQRWGRMIHTPLVDGNTMYGGFPAGTKLVSRNLEEMAAGKNSENWTYTELNCDVSSPTIWDGYIYVLQEKKQKLACLDAKTGTEKWVGELERGDTFYASPTAADGKLYIVNRKGFASVVAADPKEFRLLSTRDFDSKPTDSTIVIADGKVFVRTAQKLYCFAK